MGRRRELAPPLVGEEIEADVLALDESARAIARTQDGVEARIPGALVGERVKARVVHVDRAGRRHSRLLEVVRPSSERIDPRCPHFLECGGCDLLEASISMQHAWKRAELAHALGVELDRVEPVIASVRPFGYRALAKLVVGEGGLLGSYKPWTHEIADMQGCLVHAPEAERIVDAIRSIIQRAKEPPELRYVLVRASLDEQKAIVTLVVRREDAQGLEALASVLAMRSDVAMVVKHVNDSPGDELLGDGPHQVLHEKTSLTERLGDAQHVLLPGAFAQVNPLAAAELYRVVVSAIEPLDRRVLDLYSGSGGISLQLAIAGAREVVAVEANKNAVHAARASLNLNSAVSERVELLESSAEEAMHALSERRASFDRLVLNPPRKGASREVLESIIELAPDRVVYVSCEPKTLARDLEILGERFELHRLVPVDLFPHTRHVETVAVVRRAR
jgi:23S rRNA (uracil1939-C5)-methyltransferase